MATRLQERGLRLVSGGTDNHLMLIDLRPQKRTGKQVQDIADTVGITLNRNSIPYDEASKFNPSGVRIGTPLVTTRGMREAEMVVIADCVADLIERIDDPAVLDSIHERALPGLWPLLAAFVICAVVVPLAIQLSRRTGLMAEPGGRHAHARPTPLLGGLAMFVGFAVAVIVFVPSSTTRTGVLVVSGLAAALLIADDRWSVSPGVKFAFQLIVSLVAVAVFGFVITFIGLPDHGLH